MTDTVEYRDSSKIDPAFIEGLRANARAEVGERQLGLASEREVDVEENRRFNAFLATMPYFGDDDVIEQIVNEGRGRVSG